MYGAPTILVVLADAPANCAVPDGSLVMGNLMLGGKGVGGIPFRFVRVSHVVDAQADNVLCRAGNGALQLHGIPVSYTHLDVYKRQPPDSSDKAAEPSPASSQA